MSHLHKLPLIAGCRSDDECPYDKACFNRECLDPCIYERCGANAECSVRNHKAKCTCLPQHTGNPLRGCRRYECLSDPDCPNTLTCQNEKCVDPCDCAENAICTATNHRGTCQCREGFTGDPYGYRCDPIIIDDRCKTDGDCPSGQACLNRECLNPCEEISPCAEHATCEVKDSLPFRSMVCTCLPGFVGKGDESCEKYLEPVEEECSEDQHCQNNEACRNRECVNPCSGRNPCNYLASCNAENHNAVCTCPPGFEEDQFGNCKEIRRGECYHDTECPDDRACVQNQCQDPCRLDEPCGLKAICTVSSHRAICKCPEGWGGQPFTECFQCKFNTLPFPLKKTKAITKKIWIFFVNNNFCGNS